MSKLEDDTLLFDVIVEGEFYKEGSSHPWRGGTHTAIVSADSPAEALIEVLEGLGSHGRIEYEGGDAEWVVFDSERELVFRVSPVPSPTSSTGSERQEHAHRQNRANDPRDLT